MHDFFHVLDSLHSQLINKLKNKQTKYLFHHLFTECVLNKTIHPAKRKAFECSFVMYLKLKEIVADWCEARSITKVANSVNEQERHLQGGRRKKQTNKHENDTNYICYS